MYEINCYGVDRLPNFRACPRATVPNLSFYAHGLFAEIPNNFISDFVNIGYINIDVDLQFNGGYSSLIIDSEAFRYNLSEINVNVTVKLEKFIFEPLPTIAISNVPNLTFYLTDCRVPYIGNYTFFEFSGYAIDIENSGPTTFEIDAFAGFAATIPFVTFQNAFYSDIPSAFKLINTASLDLRYNSIGAIHDYSFCPCNRMGCPNFIVTLSLPYNQIISVDDNAFANLLNLTTLDLTGNSIFSVPGTAISVIPNLVSLLLSGNIQ